MLLDSHARSQKLGPLDKISESLDIGSKQTKTKPKHTKPKQKNNPPKPNWRSPAKYISDQMRRHTVSSILLPGSVKSFLELKFSITIAGVGPRSSHSQTSKCAWLGAEE